MNYDDLLESLTDFFSRQHHSADVARSRAESVVCIVQAHAEGDDALSETVRRFMVPPDWLGPRLSGLPAAGPAVIRLDSRPGRMTAACAFSPGAAIPDGRRRTSPREPRVPTDLPRVPVHPTHPTLIQEEQA